MGFIDEEVQMKSNQVGRPRPVQTHGEVIQGIVGRAGKARGELAEILQVPATWPEIIEAVKVLAGPRTSAVSGDTKDTKDSQAFESKSK